ncbi:MAG: fumarate reductase subunit C [Nocardioidaceae bacterium]|nr:fumarate reductase subunit C [Nocardioidaceae bacterium]NUS51795.1 fumarate reductase subunit C [Nocardioidaceae bacterium]
MNGVRTYRRPISTWWWVGKRTYFVFVMRELSSIFIAWLVVYLLLMIAAIGRGADAYDDFLRFAANPVVVVVDLVALAFVVLHTITWFGLTPKAMDVRAAGRPVPAAAVIASQYVGLVVVSAFVVWLVSR